MFWLYHFILLHLSTTPKGRWWKYCLTLNRLWHKKVWGRLGCIYKPLTLSLLADIQPLTLTASNYLLKDSHMDSSPYLSCWISVLHLVHVNEEWCKQASVIEPVLFKLYRSKSGSRSYRQRWMRLLRSIHKVMLQYCPDCWGASYNALTTSTNSAVFCSPCIYVLLITIEYH